MQNLLAPEENTTFDDDFKEYIENEIKDILNTSSTDFDDILQDPITILELEKVLSTLLNSKAPGDDGITNEYIKYSGGNLTKKLKYQSRKEVKPMLG